MPAARMRTSTSCSVATSGSGSFTTSRTSGPPTAVIRTARISIFSSLGLWRYFPQFVEGNAVVDGDPVNDEPLIQRENPGVGVFVRRARDGRTCAVPEDDHRRSVGIDPPDLDGPERLRRTEAPAE